MLVELLMDLANILTGFVNKILPDYSLNQQVVDAFTTFWLYADKFNDIFPINTMMICVVVGLVGPAVLMWGLRILSGFLSLLRGGGGVDI